MNITVNNLPQVVAEGATVTSLLPQEKTSVAVAVNGEIIPREEQSTHLLKEGDEVVLITAAFGG